MSDTNDVEEPWFKITRRYPISAELAAELGDEKLKLLEQYLNARLNSPEVRAKIMEESVAAFKRLWGLDDR